MHRTNHGFWNLALTGPIPDQALVQRCLQPPAGPLQLPLPQVSVHQPLAPAKCAWVASTSTFSPAARAQSMASCRSGSSSAQGPEPQHLPTDVPSKRRWRSPVHRAWERGSRRGWTSHCLEDRSTDAPVALFQATNRLYSHRTRPPIRGTGAMSGRRNRNNPDDRQFFRRH